MSGRVDLHVPVITRVEGEGALHVVVGDDGVETVRLEIYEPPRFFESLLRGRRHDEPIDITARICGICPVAYQLSAALAMESLSGVGVGGPIADLRRLFFCGEWIESHVLHIGFLHAPDFLGYPSGIDIAADHPDRISDLLQLKRIGNELVEVVGGRPIHPVNVRLGGFHRAPDPGRVAALAAPLSWARQAATDMIRWTAGFDFPDLQVDHELVALRNGREYPMCGGRLVSDRGLDIAVADFDDTFVERQVPYSTALHVRRRSGEPYLTGPLARWAVNGDLVPDDVRALAEEVGVAAVERNPFRSILVRGLEVLFAVIEAERIVATYEAPSCASVGVPPRAGVGWGATEAPRGVLIHRYETNDEALVTDARIIPPTAQNQAAIESDLTRLVEGELRRGRLGRNEPGREGVITELEQTCEMAIRNHDPCISCATHFLRIEVDDRR